MLLITCNIAWIIMPICIFKLLLMFIQSKFTEVNLLGQKVKVNILLLDTAKILFSLRCVWAPITHMFTHRLCSVEEVGSEKLNLSRGELGGPQLKGHKESDMTKHACIYSLTCIYLIMNYSYLWIIVLGFNNFVFVLKYLWESA